MSDISDSYFGACNHLARRYDEATGGRAQAVLTPLDNGGVLLSYLERIGPETATEAVFQIVSEEAVSFMRALDSLTLRLAKVLDENRKSLTLAAIRLGEPRALNGVVALELYCPAWGGTTALYCRYKATVNVDTMSVTLFPMERADLADEQGASWDYMYSAGVIGEIPRVVPWVAQGVAQLLFLNRATELDIRTVILPGPHREKSSFPSDSLVIAGFPGGGAAWQLSTRGSRLHIDSEPGVVELSSAQRVELTVAMARWQTMCEAIEEQRAMHQEDEATSP
jgi:hypothetical protein